ncbi:MAG: hypothetical protein ACK4RM_11475, partial [Flavobacterium sp.]
MRVILLYKLSKTGIEMMKKEKIDVDDKSDFPKEKINEILDNYDCAIVRSKTKLTKEILEKTKEVISKTNFIFMLKDPKWAESSGRIPKVLGAFLRKMQNLGFYPLLGMKK